MRDYSWVAEIALESKIYSPSLGAYFAKAISKVSFDPVSDAEMKRAWAVLARDLVHYGFDPEFDLPKDMDATIGALQTMGIDKFNQDMVDEKALAPVMTELFDTFFETIGKHPEIFELVDQADIVEDIIGTIAGRFIPLFRL